MRSSSKIALLADFVKKYAKLPEQGSIKWLRSRSKSIGGSEMNIICGVNPYSDITELVKKKLGMSVFKGNSYTVWGTIMENLVILLLEDIFMCKIIELGSLPGAVEFQKYSPDGLAYVPSLNKIILFEIKSACRRLATGSIPNMYKPQIYTGLDTIPLADMGVFVDAMIRRCSLDDWTLENSNFDKILHGDKIRKKDSPISLLMVGIYKTYGTNKSSLDLGSVDISLLTEILTKVKNGKYKAKYYLSNSLDKYKTFISNTGYKSIGVLPLKLFRLDLIEVGRDDWKEQDFVKKELEKHTCEFKSFTELYSKKISYIINTVLKALDMNLMERYDILQNLSFDYANSICDTASN